MSCSRCESAKRLWRGVRGWARVLTRRGISEKRLVIQRRAICRECPKVQLSPQTGQPLRCRECGCFLQAKTQIQQASCPIGRW